MRHLARAPRDHLSLVRRSRRSRRPIATGMREVAARRSTRFRARIRPKARRASTPTPRATWSIRVPYAVAKYRSRRITAAARRRRCSATGASTPSSATSSSPVVNLPDQLPCPVDPLHAQRRSGDLAASRGERHATRSPRFLLAQQWRRMLRFERDALAPLRPACSPSPTPTATTFAAALSRRAARAGCTSSRPASTPTYFAPATGAPASRRTWSSPARWTGCRTKTGCCTSCREILPRIRAGGARRHAQHRRPRADAGGEAARRGSPASRSPAASTTCGRTSRDGVRLRRAAAHRRRHAAEDLRSDGDGQSRGLDHHRRRRPAGDARATTSSSPTSPRAFAGRWSHLIRDDERRRRLETAARRLVVERYDWSAVARRLRRRARRGRARHEQRRGSRASPRKRSASADVIDTRRTQR